MDICRNNTLEKTNSDKLNPKVVNVDLLCICFFVVNCYFHIVI